MTDLPPPPPGQPPAWQPPAGPPPSGAPTDSPASEAPAEAAPIRPYLPDPRAPKPATPAATPPSPVAPPAADTVAPPMPPIQPIPPMPASTWAPTPGAATTAPATAIPSAAATPMPPFTPAGTPIAGSSAPAPGAPPLPDPATSSRSRLPAIIGAVVALAIGAGAVLWITGGDDGDDNSDRSDAAATTAADEPADTAAASTTPPEPTPAPASTGPAVVLPTVAPTTPPEQSTPAPLLPVLPAPPAPAGAVPYTDPAGWSIAVDPAWEFSQSEDFIGWFTGTGTDGFADNVNVTLEDLPGPMTLDDYVVAAKGFISTSAADVAIVDERRFAGVDGVEVHVITWSGSVGGGQPLAFVQAMTVTSSRAYVATFTSQPARMVELATTIGPYLLTVRGA